MPQLARNPALLPATIIGFGLGGFFDGIMLHQVLQWHHLLSLVPGEPLRDIGTQILADGLFHVLMYLVTAYGLWLLWRRRGGLAEGRGRTMFGAALLGFALWNVVDVVGFHWILGIHRIRVGVPDPLTYDLGWLAAFGLLPLACALPLLKPRQGNGAGGMGAAAALALLAVGSAALAARPQPNGGSALVVLAPGSSAGDALDVARAADARILWVDPAGRLMAVAIDEEARDRLYSAGAWLVTRSPALAGCAASLKVA
jgi:uncharacterized membrane protein